MSTHILLIDPLEKLSTKKDTSLLFAHALKKAGHDVYLLFEEDLYFRSDDKVVLKVFSFVSQLADKMGYIESFDVGESHYLTLEANVTLHFRLDPPFDVRYLRLLWILRGLKSTTGLALINDPEALCVHNEKMISYEQKSSLETYVGSSSSGFKEFCTHLNEQGHQYIILKPLDLYQGIGVERVDLAHAASAFARKCKEFSGAIVAQPFDRRVAEGEKRAIYFSGHHIGSIIKVPPKGEFLANIAQGASFTSCELTAYEKEQCDRIAEELAAKGAPWIAFDLLGEKVQEANITCPGLLCEVSNACDENLADRIVSLL